jgi:phosphopantothenoylcysteine decarboxylase/phosphopantothenate--cysteine ligase
MSRVLITSGPTRQYLDPVRYLSNASSGRMGRAIAEAAIARRHDVVVVSGPVEVAYPSAAEVISVVSTEEMLSECRRLFPKCDGLIGVAAPCDYRPVKVEPQKIHRTGGPIVLELHETPDIVATLAAEKRPNQWVVGFALETEDHRLRALAKLERKSCDLIVVNGESAIGAAENSMEVLNGRGEVIAALAGPKDEIAQALFAIVERELIARES